MIREKLIFKVPIEVSGLVCSTEGLAMISALETAYSATMSSTQKDRVCTWYDLMKGVGTTNGSDLLTLLSTSGAVLYPQIPLNDSTANAAAYSIDAISQTTLGTFNNFVAGDITPTGVIGGSTKYFDSGVNPSSYPIYDIFTSIYCRNTPTILTGNGSYNSGVVNRFLININSDNTLRGAINTASSVLYNTSTIGMLGFGRSSSIAEFLVKNGVLFSNPLSQPIAPNIFNIYFHAQNNAGTGITNAGDAELCMYMAGAPVFTPNESADFYEAMQWLQTNIITGGREV
jgi:hypothetical protein